MHRLNDTGLLTRAVCVRREVGEVPEVCPLRMLAETEAVHHRSRVSLRDVRLQETLYCAVLRLRIVGVAGEDTKPPRGQSGRDCISVDQINFVSIRVFQLEAGIESCFLLCLLCHFGNSRCCLIYRECGLCGRVCSSEK